MLQAVGVLRNLTVKMENKLTVVQEGALPPLVRLLESPEEEVQMQVAVVLRNLAVNNSNKVKMVQADALRPLLKLLKSPNVRVQEQSCACVQVRHYLEITIPTNKEITIPTSKEIAVVRLRTGPSLSLFWY